MAEATGHWTLGSLAAKLGATLVGDPNQPVARPVPAGTHDPLGVTFAVDAKYLAKALAHSVAGVIAPPEVEAPGRNLLLHPMPRAAFGHLLALFQRPLPIHEGIHDTAVIDPTAEIDPTACIGPYVVIGAHSRIGAGAVIHAHCFIGDHCEVGAKTLLYPRVTLVQDITLGARCILHSGCVLGADGFGFVWDGQRRQKIPQVGGVVVGNDVEIGSNTCIDRATAGATTLADGVKLDNLVQVGHNVHIGAHTALAGQVGIAGSTTIGARCIAGGQAAFSDHVTVGDDVHLAGRTGVMGDLLTPGEYFGIPPVPAKQAMRVTSLTTRLPELYQRLRALERELEALKRDA